MQGKQHPHSASVVETYRENTGTQAMLKRGEGGGGGSPTLLYIYSQVEARSHFVAAIEIDSLQSCACSETSWPSSVQYRHY